MTIAVATHAALQDQDAAQDHVLHLARSHAAHNSAAHSLAAHSHRAACQTLAAINSCKSSRRFRSTLSVDLPLTALFLEKGRLKVQSGGENEEIICNLVIGSYADDRVWL